MRVTNFMIFDQLTRSLRLNLRDYAAMNDRLATLKKIAKPSDDVVGTARALDYTVSINDNDQYQRNMLEGSSRLTFTNTVLNSVSKQLGSMKSLLIQNVSVQDPSLQATFAREAASIRDYLYDLANTTYRGQYLFSGVRTNVQPYSSSLAVTAYDYQGDTTAVNIAIDRGALVQVNVPGLTTFGYSLAATETRALSDGFEARYGPGAGATDVNVEIWDLNDPLNPVQTDSFSYSNMIQMADLVSGALSANNGKRLEALVEPFNRLSLQVLGAESEVGTRLVRMDTQSDRHTADTLSLQNSLSAIEDADPYETAAELKKIEVTLASLRESASRVMSQSLLDFLK